MSLLRKVSGRSGYELRFYVERQRRAIWIGKISARGVREYDREIQSLLDSRRAGVSPEPDSVRWAEGLPDRIHAKLLSYGLVPPRKIRQLSPEQRKLSAYTQAYIDELTAAERTKNNYSQTRNWLVKHLGSPDVGSITRQDMKRWQQFLKSEGLALSNRNKHVQRAKTMFRAAVDDRILPESPADAIKQEKAEAAQARGREGDGLVSAETTLRVLSGLPDTNWRLIFGLMRFQGMRRCEAWALEWTHVRWDDGMLDIHSPKTGYRECPIFADTLPILQDAFEVAKPKARQCVRLEGSEHSITPLLKKRVERILGAGNAWPKICQQLRITRRNELERQFPNHTVNEWLGHDGATASKYYLRVTDSDLEKASSLDAICTPARTPATHSMASHRGTCGGTKPQKALGIRENSLEKYPVGESKNVHFPLGETPISTICTPARTPKAFERLTQEQMQQIADRIESLSDDELEAWQW